MKNNNMNGKISNTGVSGTSFFNMPPIKTAKNIPSIKAVFLAFFNSSEELVRVISES